MRSKPYKKNVIHLTIGALLFALSSSVEAQQGVFRIGVLVAGSPTSMATRVGAFREGLRNLGYVQGRNVTLEYRYADGTLDRVQGYAEELALIRQNLGHCARAVRRKPRAPAARRLPRKRPNKISPLVGLEGVG